jgi:hypothetical protein
MTRVGRFGPFLIDLDMLQRSGNPPSAPKLDPWGCPVVEDNDLPSGVGASSIPDGVARRLAGKAEKETVQ